MSRQQVRLTPFQKWIIVLAALALALAALLVVMASRGETDLADLAVAGLTEVGAASEERVSEHAAGVYEAEYLEWVEPLAARIVRGVGGQVEGTLDEALLRAGYSVCVNLDRGASLGGLYGAADRSTDRFPRYVVITAAVASLCRDFPRPPQLTREFFLYDLGRQGSLNLPALEELLDRFGGGDWWPLLARKCEYEELHGMDWREAAATAAETAGVPVSEDAAYVLGVVLACQPRDV